MRLSKPGYICQDSIRLFVCFFFSLMVLISQSRFNTEILVSRTGVAFLNGETLFSLLPSSM